MKIISFIFGVILLACIAPTFADTLNYSTPFSFSNPKKSSDVDEINVAQMMDSLSLTETFTQSTLNQGGWLLVQQFNSEFGTLNSASFTVQFQTWEMSSSFVFKGPGSQVSAVSITSTVQIQLNSIAFPTPLTVQTEGSNVQAATYLPFSGGGSLTSTSLFVRGPQNFESIIYTQEMQLNALTAFSNDGKNTIECSIFSDEIYSILTTVKGDAALTGQSSYIGNLIVTYDYTPGDALAIPEGNSMLLLMLGGVMGCGVWIMKKDVFLGMKEVKMGHSHVEI